MVQVARLILIPGITSMGNPARILACILSGICRDHGAAIGMRLSTHVVLGGALPRSTEGKLLSLCQTFLNMPDAYQSPQPWADQLHISLRTFNRLFRQQTGLSFRQ